MKAIKAIALPVIAAILLGVSTSSSAAGHTAAQLEEAGWLCFPVPIGGNAWIHCLRPLLLGNPSVPVKVFSDDGMKFLGTELLMRYDIYSGQPCPQDNLNQWDFLGEPPYFACHRFETH